MFDTKKIADTYDQIGLYFSATRPRLSAEVVSLLPQLPSGASVLDLGCGNGVLLTALPQDAAYLGLDASSVLVTQAQKNHPKAKFVVADITLAPTWQDLGQYDFIAALAVFHHLPTPVDHIKLLQNVKQHLKPGGVCLISVWQLDLPKFDRYRNGKILAIPFHSGPKRDFYAFTEDELANLCRQTGLSQIKTTKTKNNLYYLLGMDADIYKAQAEDERNIKGIKDVLRSVRKDVWSKFRP